MTKTPGCFTLALLAASILPAQVFAQETKLEDFSFPNVPPSSQSTPQASGSETNQNQQLAAPKKPDVSVLERIMSTNPETIVIEAKHRDDLRSCEATEGEAMMIALYNCWPLLEGFQTYREAKEIARDHRRSRRALMRDKPEYLGSKEYQASLEAEYDDAIRSAKKIEALAGKREYPMQDMLLFLANLMQSSIAKKRDDFDTALASVESSIMLFETTKITEPDFANLEALQRERTRLLDRKAEASK
jgi:predicted S18 family serine protease